MPVLVHVIRSPTRMVIMDGRNELSTIEAVCPAADVGAADRVTRTVPRSAARDAARASDLADLAEARLVPVAVCMETIRRAGQDRMRAHASCGPPAGHPPNARTLTTFLPARPGRPSPPGYCPSGPHRFVPRHAQDPRRVARAVAAPMYGDPWDGSAS